MLPGEVEERADLRQPVARLGEVAMVLLQLFVAGADIDVGFRIVGEVAARKGPVRALGLIEHLYMRFDTALVHQPAQHLRRAVARVGTSACRMAVVASTSMITACLRSTR